MTSVPHAHIDAEALRLLDRIDAAGAPLRMLGGMAVRVRLTPELARRFVRPVPDIDFAAASGEQRTAADLLEAAGYAGDEAFNAMNGARRLLFFDLANGRQIDVFVGAFEMCHTIPLEGRLLLEKHTIPAAELLLTKLQIVELNPKDRQDAIALLACLPVASHDGEAINAERIGELCAHDWGLWRTTTLNLERIAGELDDVVSEPDLADLVRDRLARLSRAVELAPKPRRWRARDRLGDRKRWYELPDEVGATR